MQSFVDYIEGPARECMSHFDGGQLMFNFLLREQKTLMWSGHLGGYDGILKAIEPKPNVLIQAIAGRANLNGRPFDGSAAQFATSISHWLGEPKMVVWCLHYDSPINPWTVDVSPATKLMDEQTRSKVICPPAFASKMSPTANGTSSSLACPQCGQIFRRREHLNRHLDRNSGARTYACSICNKSFSRRCACHCLTVV
jgi:uncharacterized C2H2 Zn-finger protein